MELSAYPSVVLSWEFSQFGILKEDTGIIFHVQGYKFNGWVKVIYDDGADLFNVVFQSNEGETIQEKRGIYLDGLVDVIDRYVEKTDDYENRVKEEYSLIMF